MSCLWCSQKEDIKKKSSKTKIIIKALFSCLIKWEGFPHFWGDMGRRERGEEVWGVWQRVQPPEGHAE